jgi:hypothetical protein
MWSDEDEEKTRTTMGRKTTVERATSRLQL